MTEIISLVKPELKVPNYSSSKPFSSRPYGIIQIFLLAINIFLYLILILILWKNDDILDGGAGGSALIFLVTILVFLLFFLLSAIFFLVWLYKIHQDLWFLFKGYPIKPWGAIARAIIPVYSLWGMYDVFNTMREKFMPGFGKWIAAYYILLFSQSFSNFIPSTEPLSIVMFFVYLISTVLYLLMTLKIHRALAEKFAHQLAISTLVDEYRSDPLQTDYAALDTQSRAHSATEPVQESVSMNQATIESAAPVPSPGKKQKSRTPWLIIGLVGVFLTFCALSICALVTVGGYNLLRWFDLDYFNYFWALDEYVAFDDSINTITAENSFIQNNSEETEVWLIIRIETPMQCTGRSADTCELLANDIAAFTLENHASIEEYDGLSVTITTINGNESGLTIPDLEKAMSIAQWQKSLRAVSS